MKENKPTVADMLMKNKNRHKKEIITLSSEDELNENNTSNYFFEKDYKFNLKT